MSYIKKTIQTLIITTLLLLCANAVCATITSLTLSTPVDDAWPATATPPYSFTVVSNNTASMSCLLRVNNIPFGINASTLNNTLTTINANTSLVEGTTTWNITCTDNDYTNSSANYTINYDTTNASVTINTPANTSGTDSNPEIQFTITDNLALQINYTFYVNDTFNVSGLAYNNTLTNVSINTITSGPFTVVIQAKDNATNRINSTKLYLEFDDQAPTVTINSPANASFTTDTSPAINFTITDGINPTTEYTFFVDGSSNATGTVNNDTATIVNVATLAEGTHTIIIQGKDNAENFANSTPLVIFVDTTAPTALLNDTINNTFTNDTSPEINFTLTDGISSAINYTIYLDGTANATGTVLNNTATFLNLSTLSEGKHSIIVEATDNASNSANSSHINITVDTSIPTSTINTPANNSGTDSNPEIQFTITDNSALQINYTFFVNDTFNVTGLAYNNTLTNVSINTITSGPFTVVVQAQDNASNKVNSTKLYLEFDDQAPTVTITSPANATYTTDTSPAINFTISDGINPTTEYTFFVDGSSNATGTVNNDTATIVNVATLAEGTHTIIIQGKDNAENFANSTPLVIFVDTTAPTSLLNDTINNTFTNDTTPEINFTLTDGISSALNYTIYIDGVSNVTGVAVNATATFLNLSLIEGPHYIVVEATDNASNSANSSAINITIDTTAANSVVSLPINNSLTNKTPEIQFKLTDNYGAIISYTVYINQTANVTGNAANNTLTNISLATIPNGTYSVIIEATDNASNAVNSTVINLQVDLVAPKVTIDSPANATLTSDNSPAITFTAQDNLSTNMTYKFYVDGSANATSIVTNNTQTVVNISTLDDGTHTIIIEVNDSIGNVVNSTTLSITVDTTAPTSLLNDSLNNTWINDTTPEINFTLTDGYAAAVNYTIYIDGTANTTGTAVNDTAKFLNLSTLSQGTHNIIVQATDNASNSANSSTLILHIDTTAPTATINSPANASYTNTTPAINFTLTDNLGSIVSYLFFVNDTANASGTVANNTASIVLIETLSAGPYEVIVQATDNVSNKVNSTTLTITVDTTVPKLPASINATAQTNGAINVTWSAVTQDISSGSETVQTYRVFRTTNITALNTSVFTESIANTTSLTYTDTSVTTGTNYTYVVTVLDNGDNYNNTKAANASAEAAECTTTYTYGAWSTCSGSSQSRTGTRTCYGGGSTSTTETQTCSSGGGSSGYNNPGASASVAPKASRLWYSLEKEKPVSLFVTKDEIGLTEIKFSLKEKKTNVRISVEKLDGKPAEVKQEIKGKVHKYIEIKKENVENEDFEGTVTIDFKVEKEWLDDNGLQKDEIVLKRFTTTWADLVTRFLREDGKYLYFEADTPGFSYFAIGEKEDIIEPAATMEETSIEPDYPTAQVVEEEEVVEIVDEEIIEDVVTSYSLTNKIGLVALVLLVGIAAYFIVKRLK